MKILGKNCGVIVAALSILVASSVASAQTRSRFRFSTTPNGRFIGSLTLDESAECLHYLFARVQTGPDGETVGVPLSVVTKGANARRVSFRAGKLPAVLREVDGAPVRFNFAVSSICEGAGTIQSNTYARFVKCGRNKKATGLNKNRVPPERWISILSNKLSK